MIVYNMQCIQTWRYIYIYTIIFIYIYIYSHVCVYIYISCSEVLWWTQWYEKCVCSCNWDPLFKSNNGSGRWSYTALYLCDVLLHLLSFWLNIELTSGCASHWRYLFSTYTTVISIIYPFFRFKASPRHTRLKSRKTRKARIIRSKPKGPGRGTWNTSWKMGRKPKPRFFLCV